MMLSRRAQSGTFLGAQTPLSPLPLCQVDNYLVAIPGQSGSHQSASVSLHAAPPPSLCDADPVFPRDHALAPATNSRNCDVFSFRKPRTPTVCAAPYRLASYHRFMMEDQGTQRINGSVPECGLLPIGFVGCGAAAHAIARGCHSVRHFTIACHPSYWLRHTLPTAL